MRAGDEDGERDDRPFIPIAEWDADLLAKMMKVENPAEEVAALLGVPVEKVQAWGPIRITARRFTREKP